MKLLLRSSVVLFAVGFGVLPLVSCGGGGGASPSAPTPPQTSTIGLNGNLDFGNVLVGSTWTSVLTITNGGNGVLNITGMTGPTGFTSSFTSGTIAAGASQPATITFSPSAPGDYGGTIIVTGNQVSGNNSIKVTAFAFPAMNGAWSGTLTASAASQSGSCIMSWIVGGQTGAQFSGTWQTSGSRCGQAGTLTGTVDIDSQLTSVSIAATESPSTCSRIAGDGLFKGVLSSGLATLQSIDTIRCPGLADINRSTTVSMRKQ